MGTNKSVGFYLSSFLTLAALTLILITCFSGSLLAQGLNAESTLETIYITEVEEAVESEGFKPVITRTAGPLRQKPNYRYALFHQRHE
ncbi:MAG: hypothetical protein LBE31_11940 [Deltaproteobacteria bacterium]|jgi:hypothetical protein|nr:hypothetical protein [Deltaproteobacteria bacterium]